MHELKLNWRPTFTLMAVLVLAGCGGGSGTKQAVELEGVSDPVAGAPALSEGFHLGAPLDDVERYFGLYGEPGRGQFFVTEAKRPEFAEQAPEVPPGYLAIGAMWADVAPMHMKSLSEAKFEHVDLSDFAQSVPAVAEFEFGPDGKAIALTFTSGNLTEFGRRERTGDVPAEWR